MLDKYPEALSLLQRGSLYVRQAQAMLATFDTQAIAEEAAASGLQMTGLISQQIPTLQSLLERAEDRTSKDWYAFTLVPSPTDNELAASIGHVGLPVENLSLQNTATGRRGKKARKVGPVFFDVAFSYIATVGTEMQADDLVTEALSKDTVSTVPTEKQTDPSSEVSEKTSETTSSEQAGGRGLWGLFGRRK